jgi:hypothetical protein
MPSSHKHLSSLYVSSISLGCERGFWSTSNWFLCAPLSGGIRHLLYSVISTDKSFYLSDFLDSSFLKFLGLYRLPNRVLHTVRSRASSLKFQYLVISLRSLGSCLHLSHRLPVPSMFPSITCFTKQFLHKMWPIQLASLRFIVCKIFVSPWLYITLLHFSHVRSLLIFSSLLQHHISKLSSYFWSIFRNV